MPRRTPNPKCTLPGVVVLLGFAGAAGELEEALIVDAYNIGDRTNTMQATLKMPLREGRQGHSALSNRIGKHDVRHWHKSRLKVLKACNRRAVA